MKRASLVIECSIEKSETNKRFIKERRTDMDFGQGVRRMFLAVSL